MRALAVGIGAVHTAIAVRSQSMNEDGISYLDLGDAFWQGRWEEVANTTWSPLYAWIVGAVVNLMQPSMAWEFPTVQLVNFSVYLVTLLCFEYFWRELSVAYDDRRRRRVDAEGFPPLVWAVIGYSLFIYVSLNLITVWAVSPDMCVAAISFLGAGRVLKFARCGATVSSSAAFGSLLGVGYLTKAVMLPLGFVLIVLTALLPIAGASRSTRFSASLAAFLLVAAPWALVVSDAAAHPTFSDVSRFTYLKHVDGMPWPQWQKVDHALAGKALHPPRQIHEDPPVWEFGTPIGGTYPLAYDPAWWTQGLSPSLDPAAQTRTVLANAKYYFDLFVRMQGGLLAIAALLLWSSFASKRSEVRFDGPNVLLLWALAALALYALVYAESRYLGPFVLLLWTGALANVRLPPTEAWTRLAARGGAAFALFVWVNIGSMNLEGLAAQLGIRAVRGEGAIVHESTRALSGEHRVSHPDVARGLVELGVTPGSRVAFIGYSYSAYWARLARLRIVAEIRPEDADAFWSAGAVGREAVFAAFARAGAVAVVVERGEVAPSGEAFVRLPESDYLVRLLDESS